MPPTQAHSKPVSYDEYVIRVTALMTKEKGSIDQPSLCRTVGLAPSYLILDTTTLSSSTAGIQTWASGFHRLVDIMLVLHKRDELQIETLNRASQACSECWTMTCAFQGLQDARTGVRSIAARLQGILDPNGIEYKGEKVYGIKVVLFCENIALSALTFPRGLTASDIMNQLPSLDHQTGHQPYLQQAHFAAPHQHQPQHQTQSTSVSPQPQYYTTPQDHAGGYVNAQSYGNPQQGPYTVPTASMQQHPQVAPARASMVPPRSITQETYQSPVIAQPGSDWAKDLIRQAKASELKKHSLTLQLHTAQIISAHSSLEQKNKKLEDAKTQKEWLESERARLLDELRQVDLSESALQREVNELKNKIKVITEGEYGAAKNEVEMIRKELGLSPLPSLQTTLEEKGARGFIPYTSVFGATDVGPSRTGSNHKRRLDQPDNETPTADAEIPATVPTSVIQSPQGSETIPDKRGPGRPRKVDTNGNLSLPGPPTEPGRDGVSPTKRPRGRPKGSKNKPKVISDPTSV
ncbi:Zinc finger-containing protein [Rhizoctonia solani]|uniref:Zinc finger-containing protein n=1 Tax=Rhizoctonia solani TaxID=456999 RepID=A0A8H7HCM7_9AGAM|nr:Zinc finger-containing protein [Rhizoctonia solani]